MTRQRASGEAAKRRLDASIHFARARLTAFPARLAAYDALVGCVHRWGTLLSRRTACRGLDVSTGLLALAAHEADWVRPVETWTAAESSPWRQFASLAEHLLARFAVPRFMASAWLESTQGARVPPHDWYKRLGQGENVRRLGLPIRLTRAMAHRFLSAPDHLTVIGALRWTQVVTLGGSSALAAALSATPLGRELRNEDFWETVIHFLLGAPELDLAHVGPIVDFLHAQRFGGRMGVTASGEYGPLPPRDPTFSMKGRTASSILRMVDGWHRELAETSVPGRSWARSALRELTWVERVVVRAEEETRTESRAWAIKELCSTGALDAEGRAMHHCVATYAERCLGGQTSIWSVQVETPKGLRRVLTFEVDMVRRRICQARRRFNARPSEAEREVVLRWARREGLDVDATM